MRKTHLILLLAVVLALTGSAFTAFAADGKDAAPAAASSGKDKPMTIGIALQLYSLRDAAKKDLDGTLKKVREIGFEYVQWSGMPDLPAKEIRAKLDAAGLKCIAAHCGMEAFEKDFAKEVEFWKTVGCKDVAPGGMMGDCRDSLKDWLRGAARLDAIGAKLRENGMRLSYHNHAGEFETFPGDTMNKLDHLYKATSPTNLYAELDTAWAQVGDTKPADFLKKYPGRCPVIHVKDMKAEMDDGHPIFTPLGQGCLDWAAIHAAAKEAKVEWYVYEQDNAGDGDAFECARISFNFLSELVKK